MAHILRGEVEKLKKFYISKLLDYGVYKTDNRQLYELTLTDLEEIYKKMKYRKYS